jgi:hypothetical protein
VIIPLADLLGLSRQMVVVAYQYSGLVSGLITPTAGALLAMLSLAGVSYGRWIRFMMVPFALMNRSPVPLTLRDPRREFYDTDSGIHLVAGTVPVPLQFMGG